MSSLLTRLATRAAYGASQGPRLAWYAGHSLAMRRLSQAVRKLDGERARPSARTDKPVPDRNRLLADMAELLKRDVANVEAGLYPLPVDHDGSLATLLNRSRLFFEDLPRIHRRRQTGTHSDVLSDETRGKRPRYYLQNFHFQSGGWMTDESAQRYDTQVEVFFGGTANAMRRQALPELHEAFAGRDQRGLRLLDVGSGTGRFLASVKQVWPRLPVTGLDLSEAYIREAKHHLSRWSSAGLTVGKAESLPVPDASQDAVTSIFLFHELPPKVRRVVFGEFARVLKPGGRLVIVDSLQFGDKPEYDGSLELFPQNFHEPYFASYAREDFGKLATRNGLTHTRDVNVFVSKVMVFDKSG
jgi:ubiquinone/menaquinone biosynthesis C-methylase UbiE